MEKDLLQLFSRPPSPGEGREGGGSSRRHATARPGPARPGGVAASACQSSFALRAARIARVIPAAITWPRVSSVVAEAWCGAVPVLWGWSGDCEGRRVEGVVKVAEPGDHEYHWIS